MLDFESLIKLPTPLTEIFDELFIQKEVRVFVKRDDLTHLHISGNKYRKLKYNVKYAKENGIESLVTFGGAYSNHLAAFAETCYQMKIKGTVIVRGDELNPESNETLKRAHGLGIELVFVDRSSYRIKEELARKYAPNAMYVPEGGSNENALPGVAELLEEQFYPDYICTASGTGGTASGLLSNEKFEGEVVIIPVLKGGDFIKENIENLLKKPFPRRGNLFTEYHFGGYGKYNEELLEFIEGFELKHKVPLDQVYTGKMFFGVMDLIKKDFFAPNSTIFLLHTGGLQGKLKY